MNRRILLHFVAIAPAILIFHVFSDCRAEDAPAPSLVLKVWPDTPPDFTPSYQPEADTSAPDANRVAGKTVIRLGNVQSPELHVYQPTTGASSTAIVVCPGGGYSILAWDLEGTEIAQWLQKAGVTAIVLKYRVPSRDASKKWLAPVQDIQRSIELVRTGQVAGVKVDRVGVLGFSAGGNASARAATTQHKHFSIDSSNQATTRTDEQPTSAEELKGVRPDFAVLVYPAWLVKEDDSSQLIDDVTVDNTTPPMFFAHARNDRVSCLSSVTLFTELQKRDIPAALHIFADGGHGFGARPVSLAHDRWPGLCEDWMRDRGWLAQ